MNANNRKVVKNNVGKVPKNTNQQSGRVKNFLASSEAHKLSETESLQIVFKLIQQGIQEENLCEHIPFITQNNYHDVNVERNIDDLCGYPLCDNKWTDSFTKQRYIIRANAVYDIEERRMFCSNKCYEASEILKVQIPEVPLYLREDDQDIANMKITIPDLSKIKGKYGAFINVSEPDALNNKENSAERYLKAYMDMGSGSSTGPDPLSNVPLDAEDLNPLMEELSVSTRRHDGKSTLNRDVKKSTEDLIIETEMFIRSWMTFSTLYEVLGENYLKGMLEHFGEIWSDYESDIGLHMGIEAKTKYLSMCKKIDQQEIEDEIKDRKKPKLPQGKLPDIQQLRIDTEKDTSKIRSFLVGTEEETVDDAIEMMKGSQPKEEKNSDLPLIDRYEQTSWRFKIFKEKLNVSLPRHSRNLDLDTREVFKIATQICSTFDLQPNNIPFKPIQWDIVSMVILKMISVRYSVVSGAFCSEKGRKYIQTLTNSWGLDGEYLDRLLTYSTELQPVLTKRNAK